MLESVTKTFGSKIAVKDLNFSIDAGSFFALLGPNGAGKTTLIRLISTLLRPTQGSIFVGGCDCMRNPAGVRSQVGVVFQNNSLDDELTVGENIKIHGLMHSLDNKIASRRSSEVLDLMGLTGRASILAKFLSGGEKRRVEIARALMHRPRIIFLDEPTVGLDTKARDALWVYLQKANLDEGVTVVFTTHYLEEAESNASTVAIIDKGIMAANGTVAELGKISGSEGLKNAYLKVTE